MTTSQQRMQSGLIWQTRQQQVLLRNSSENWMVNKCISAMTQLKTAAWTTEGREKSQKRKMQRRHSKRSLKSILQCTLRSQCLPVTTKKSLVNGSRVMDTSEARPWHRVPIFLNICIRTWRGTTTKLTMIIKWVIDSNTTSTICQCHRITSLLRKQMTSLQAQKKSRMDRYKNRTISHKIPKMASQKKLKTTLILTCTTDLNNFRHRFHKEHNIIQSWFSSRINTSILKNNSHIHISITVINCSNCTTCNIL